MANLGVKRMDWDHSSFVFFGVKEINTLQKGYIFITLKVKKERERKEGGGDIQVCFMIDRIDLV
jgi:hypothetical protein